MRKLSLLLGLMAFIMLCGCASTAILSRLMTGTQDTTIPQKVLTYNENITNQGFTFYTAALSKITEKEDKADNKTILKLANLVDDELARKSKAGEESRVAMIGNTAVRIMEQPEVRKKVEEGLEFGMNALTMAITGGVGGLGGLLALARRRIGKEVLKNKIKTKEINTDPAMLKAVNESAEHTAVAGIIT